MVQPPKLPPSSVGGNAWVQLRWIRLTRRRTIRDIAFRVRDVTPTKMGNGGPPALNSHKAGYGHQH